MSYTANSKLILFLCFLSSFWAQNKAWTVDNNPGNSAANYTSIQGANDNASVKAGDTLYVAGSSVNFGTVTLTKRLTLIGPGYFLTENINLQANPSTAKINIIQFNSGSQNSVFMGFEITDYVNFTTSNIIFRRNLVRSTNNIQVWVGANIGNIVIAQNYILNTYSSGNVVDVAGNTNNIFITNNYIAYAHAIHASYNVINTSVTNSNVSISQNVLSGSIRLQDLATFQNNIWMAGVWSAAKVTPTNNICNNSQFTGNNNVTVANFTTIFVSSGTTDSKWKILASSLADDTGISGEDLGMFGGASPYVLSGVPPIPSIYSFIAPISGSKTGGLQIQLKVKSNN